MIKTPLKITPLHTHLKTPYLPPFLFQDDNLKTSIQLGAPLKPPDGSHTLAKIIQGFRNHRGTGGHCKAFKSHGINRHLPLQYARFNGSNDKFQRNVNFRRKSATKSCNTKAQDHTQTTGSLVEM